MTVSNGKVTYAAVFSYFKRELERDRRRMVRWRKSQPQERRVMKQEISELTAVLGRVVNRLDRIAEALTEKGEKENPRSMFWR